MAGPIDLVALDYYHRATPTEHLALFRRTTELVSRCEGTGAPAYAAELGVGFPPFFRPIDPQDSVYTLLAGLAYGLRGFNLYMAVERDRWIGAPIDPHGKRRPLADAYEAIVRALEAVRWGELRRRAPVRLVIPRSLRRLARASHAFGPLTPALFNILGAGYRESCLEDDFGFGVAPTALGEAYLRAFERALFARGVPFAYAGGESLDVSLRGAAWVIAVLAGGVKGSVLTQLQAAFVAGARVTVGPTMPDRDGSMRRLATPYDPGDLEVEPLLHAARADGLVARRIEELGLPTYPIDHTEAYVAVHEDAAGVPRVAFVMNPTAGDLAVRASIRGGDGARRPVACEHRQARRSRDAHHSRGRVVRGRGAVADGADAGRRDTLGGAREGHGLRSARHRCRRRTDHSVGGLLAHRCLHGLLREARGRLPGDQPHARVSAARRRVPPIPHPRAGSGRRVPGDLSV